MQYFVFFLLSTSFKLSEMEYAISSVRVWLLLASNFLLHKPFGGSSSYAYSRLTNEPVLQKPEKKQTFHFSWKFYHLAWLI